MGACRWPGQRDPYVFSRAAKGYGAAGEGVVEDGAADDDAELAGVLADGGVAQPNSRAFNSKQRAICRTACRKRFSFSTSEIRK